MLFAGGIAHASPTCLCETADIDARWRAAGAVFDGTVEEIRPVARYAPKPGMDPAVEVVLRVGEAFKGAATGEAFTLHTNLTKSTCMGHPFEQGESYLVFAYKRPAETRETRSLYNFPSGTWDVGGLCGGTQTLKNATAGEILTLRLKRAAAQAGIE